VGVGGGGYDDAVYFFRRPTGLCPHGALAVGLEELRSTPSSPARRAEEIQQVGLLFFP
jgi:hypothetical protein